MSLAYSKPIGPWVPLPSSFGVIFGLWNIFRTRRCGCPRYFCVASVLTGLCLSCSFFQCKVYLHIFNLPFFIFFVPYFRIAYAQFSCSFLSGLLFALSRSSRLLNSVQSLKRWGYRIRLSYSFNSGCDLTSSALHTAASSAWGHFFPQLSTAFLFTLHTLRSAGLRSFLRPPAPWVVAL